MTEFEFYTSITLVTLLIVGLMWWLRGEFEKLSMTPEERMAKLENEYHKLCEYWYLETIEPIHQVITKEQLTEAYGAARNKADTLIVRNPERHLALNENGEIIGERILRRKHRDNPQRGK